MLARRLAEEPVSVGEENKGSAIISDSATANINKKLLQDMTTVIIPKDGMDMAGKLRF